MRRPRWALDLPTGSPLELRVARAVTVLATVWFALAASWEIGGPLLAGHYATSASIGIIAENMLRWGIAGPVWEYTATPPAPSAYYCHHPWGIFWTTALLMRLLGRHDFVCRLAPVLLSTATPPLLYAIGRALWRPAAGAAAAVGFVVLPIALAFAHFNALEVPVMTWSLLASWGFVRLAQTGRPSFLAASAIGTVLALNADWPALLLVGALLAFAVARGTVLRGFFGPVGFPRVVRAWWLVSAGLACSTIALYAWLFHRSGKVDDLWDSYHQRSGGGPDEPSVSSFAAIVARRSWIELSFTEIGVVLGVLGAAVSVWRLVRLRREHEVVPLVFLFMAAVQYVVFREGADVHVFWPQYFAVSFALGTGALVASATSVIERRPSVAHPGLVSLAVAIVPLAAILRDAVPVLRYARATGGRFDERGNLIDSDGEKITALRWLATRLPREGVALSRSMAANWSQAWALGGRPVTFNARTPLGAGADPFSTWIADSRRLPDGVQADVVRRFHVVAIGPFWSVDLREPPAPIDAYSFEEREPTLAEWYFVSGTEPVRQVVPDAFSTWELRTHFDQPAALPLAQPITLEEKRIAYDVALAEGDAPRAAVLLGELSTTMTPRDGELADGTQIVGTTLRGGVLPTVTLWLRAGGPAGSPSAQIAVRSRVEGRGLLSTIMADPVVCEVGQPLALSPHRWRAGWLYSDRIQIRRRLGPEVFWAESTSRTHASAPLPDDQPRVEVMRMR